MADDDQVKSTDKLLQALDALSQLNQARVTSRSNFLPLTRSGSSSKDGSDAGAGDEARPRARVSPRLSPTSPIWSKPNNMVDEEEEGDDSPLIIIIKPRHRLPLTLPFRARSKLIKKQSDDFDDYHDDDYDEDDDAASLLKSLGFAPVTPDADGERKGITYHGPIRVMSQIGLRRMSCLFTVEVVAAQGLPAAMNGMRLAVAVRRKETRDGAVRTMPARVRLGAADFDEVLCVRCSLYGATGRPVSFEPRPFVVSLVAVDAPEMDLGRSAVDLGLFAKEFVEKRGRQWDMAFPLAGMAKGGELVVKLAFQSIDDDGSAEWYSQPAGEDRTASYASLSSFGRSSVRKRRVVPRKLRRSSVSSVLTNPKMTPAETVVPTPELSSSDSFKVDEPEVELTRIEEVKETQQKELECEPADKPTLVSKLESEEHQKELECEPTDESTPVTDVDEEGLQTESEQEPTDEATPVAEVEEERQKELEREPIDEPNPVDEVDMEEQQKEPEQDPSDEPTPLIEMNPTNEPTTIAGVNEEAQQIEQQKEAEQEPPSDEPTPLIKVDEEVEQQKEPEPQSADEPTTTAEVKEEEQQKEPECELTDETTPMAEAAEEEQQQVEIEHEPADDPTPVTEMKEEEQQEELVREPADEPTPITEVKEEEQKEPEHEVENTQEHDGSDLPDFNVVDKCDERQEVMVELEEMVEVNKRSEEEHEASSLSAADEVAKVTANGLEDKSFQVTVPSDVPDVVANTMEPVNGDAARPKEITRESLQLTEQGNDKGAAKEKLAQPRFKWRTVALLVPLAILNSKALGARR